MRWNKGSDGAVPVSPPVFGCKSRGIGTAKSEETLAKIAPKREDLGGKTCGRETPGCCLCGPEYSELRTKFRRRSGEAEPVTKSRGGAGGPECPPCNGNLILSADRGVN